MSVIEQRPWRVMIDQGDGNWIRDQLRLRVLERVQDGYWPYAIIVERGPEMLPSNAVVPAPIPESLIPTELCEVLLSALARYLMGAEDGDLVAKIQRLERELTTSNSRLDALIAGIGRMGGQNT